MPEPEAKTIRVYCAGKIAPSDWRHDLFPGLRGALQGAGARPQTWEAQLEPLVVAREPERSHTEVDLRLVYAGPYFLTYRHGGAHGRDAHGQRDSWELAVPREAHGAAPAMAPGAVVGRCLGWLLKSDIVFAWLDSPTAYGTVAEIGFARGIGIPVFGYVDRRRREDLSDLWFAQHLCQVLEVAPDPYQAWGRFVVQLARTVRYLGLARNAYLDGLKRPPR